MFRKAWLQKKVRSRVSLICEGDVTFNGLLVSTDADGVVLVGATHYAEDGTPTPLSGEVMVPRGQIRFVQHSSSLVGQQ